MSSLKHSGYHDFVFRDGKLVGEFEEMYAAEEQQGFDSWFSHDARHLRLRLTLAMIADYNFSSILEIGCGKGTAAQFLKQRNNRVVGIDISPTAIAKARASFPDIEFHCMNAGSVGDLQERFDLISMQAVLAYIPDWRELLVTVSGITERCLVVEYVPKNPMGMVSSLAELEGTYRSLFEVEEKLVLNDETAVLLGKVRA